jgi:hypothetical protein
MYVKVMNSRELFGSKLTFGEIPESKLGYLFFSVSATCFSISTKAIKFFFSDFTPTPRTFDGSSARVLKLNERTKPTTII